MFSLSVNDTTAGFRIYSRKVLSKIDFSSLKSQGFSFQIEMLRNIVQQNGKIEEIPIIFRERQYGRSKINLGIIIEAFLYVTKSGLKNRLNKLMQ